MQSFRDPSFRAAFALPSQSDVRDFPLSMTVAFYFPANSRRCSKRVSSRKVLFNGLKICLWLWGVDDFDGPTRVDCPFIQQAPLFSVTTAFCEQLFQRRFPDFL
jgi:hypothetical protein